MSESDKSTLAVARTGAARLQMIFPADVAEHTGVRIRAKAEMRVSTATCEQHKINQAVSREQCNQPTLGSLVFREYDPKGNCEYCYAKFSSGMDGEAKASRTNLAGSDQGESD